MTGASTNMDSSSIPACITPVSLVSHPAFIATLVLAIAAVAGTPPKKGITILPIPCAISSLSALSSSFFIFPADAPQSRLSIIPRAAIESAGTNRSQNFAKSIPAIDSLSSRNSDLGISPTIATSSLRKQFAISMIMSAASDDGTLSLSFFGQITIMMITASPMHIVGISG